MNVLGIIPARKGSKGIPGKNLRLLGNRPLVAYTFDIVPHCRSLTRVILSTDSESIAALGHATGIEVPFRRPDPYARDDSPAAAYVRHALDYLTQAEGYRPDIAVLLQPTAPFRQAQDVDCCVERLIHSGADCIVSVTPLPRQLHPQWQLTLTDDGQVRPFASEPWAQLAARRQQLAQTYTRNGAVYAFWVRVFDQTGSIYGDRVLGHVMPAERSINLDDMEDWRRAEDYLRQAAIRWAARPPAGPSQAPVRPGVDSL